jgi:hypothetical protein
VVWIRTYISISARNEHRLSDGGLDRGAVRTFAYKLMFNSFKATFLCIVKEQKIFISKILLIPDINIWRVSFRFLFLISL